MTQDLNNLNTRIEALENLIESNPEENYDEQSRNGLHRRREERKEIACRAVELRAHSSA